MKDFFRLLAYAKPYKANLIGYIVFVFLSIFFSLFSLGMVIPFIKLVTSEDELVTTAPPISATDFDTILQNLYYHISQLIITHGNEAVLMIIAVGVIIMFFFKNLFRYLSKFVLAPLRNGISKDIRNEIYQKITRLPLSFYSNKQRGDIIARATTDVQNIEFTVISSFELIFLHTLTVLMFLGTLFWMNWELSLIMVLVFPIAGGIIGRIGKALKKKSRVAQDLLGNILSMYEEGIGGLRIIKAFNAIRKENKRFNDINGRYTQVLNGVQRRTDLASPLSEFLSIIITAIILWYGGLIVLNGDGIDGSAFVGYLMIFSQILPSIKAFSTALYKIQKGSASAQRIWEVIEADESIRDIENPIQKKEFTSEISYSDINFKYKEEPVLKNVNLDIKKGQTVALVGASGAGKSTMVDLLPRFFDLENGAINIDGINIKEIKINDLRSMMGIVTQESILFNDTITNNIAFGSDDIDEEAVVAAAKAANAHDFILETPEQYNSIIGDKGNQLSGGQRQRLTIARAIYKNPPIMILDEATSALDTESEKLVQDALDNLMQNRTSIVIAHRLSTIQKADRIVVMDKGEIKEIGTHTELLAKGGIYKKLHSMQND